MPKHHDKHHTDEEIKSLQKDYDAVIAEHLGAHVAESIVESDKAAAEKVVAASTVPREAFDEACEIATKLRLNIHDHDDAVAKVAALRAKVDAS